MRVLLLLLLCWLVGTSQADYLYTKKTNKGGASPQPPPPSPTPERGTAVGTVGHGPSVLQRVMAAGADLAEKAAEVAVLAQGVAKTATDPDLLNAMWKDSVTYPRPWADTLVKLGLTGLAAWAFARAFGTWRKTRQGVTL